MAAAYFNAALVKTDPKKFPSAETALGLKRRSPSLKSLKSAFLKAPTFQREE